MCSWLACIYVCTAVSTRLAVINISFFVSPDIKILLSSFVSIIMVQSASALVAAGARVNLSNCEQMSPLLLAANRVIADENCSVICMTGEDGGGEGTAAAGRSVG